MKETMIIKFKWDEKLGKCWMNPDNLAILLYTKAETKKELLQCEVVDLTEPDNWISVKDELPEVDVQVRAIVEHWNTENRYEIHLIYVKKDDHDWKVWDTGKVQSELSNDWSVICWQPLPQPPKDK